MIHKDKQDKWFHDDSVNTTRTGKPQTIGDKFKVTNGQWIDGIIEPPIKDESILSEDKAAGVGGKFFPLFCRITRRHLYNLTCTQFRGKGIMAFIF